jgi:hypothetical protein
MPVDSPPQRATAATMAALDLDRTLIYSASAAGAPASLPPLRVVECYDGAPLSRMTHRSWALLAELMQRAVVVPVTTRTVAQYARVLLPAVPRYALCANGGALLVDGAPDLSWTGWVQEVTGRAGPLAAVLDRLSAVAGEPWVKTVRTADDLFCYLVAHSRAAVPDAWLADFSAAAAADGWTVSVQGRKVYAVPAGLSKASALLRLRDVVADSTGAPVFLLAAGDSLLDAPMLTGADEAIRPAHGELHEQGWTPPQVAVTAASGAMAGEEIVDWMLARATG